MRFKSISLQEIFCVRDSQLCSSLPNYQDAMMTLLYISSSSTLSSTSFLQGEAQRSLFTCGNVVTTRGDRRLVTRRCTLPATPTTIQATMTPEPAVDGAQSARGENARRLAQWVAAEWSNREQAIENPPMWAHIHVSFRPLPWKLFDGYSFYTESAYNYDLSTPYKTSVIHLIESDLDPSIIEFVSYKLKNADDYWYGSHEPSLLNQLTDKDEQLMQLNNDCNTLFKWMPDKNIYVALSKPGKNCKIKRRADPDLMEKFKDLQNEDGFIETYLDTTITLSENRYTAWDIGRHPQTDERVWGPAGGAFDFSPVQRFDVPLEE